LFFDPQNEEFYVDSFDVDSGHTAKIILSDIEEIIDEVHGSLHDYINGDDHFTDDGVYLQSEDEFAEEDCETDEDDMDEEYYQGEQINEDDIFEEIDVDWSTPEVTAFKHEDEVEVTYQFGV